VLIYFDDALKKRVIEELQRSLAPGGYLMLGSAESLYGISDKFQSIVMQGSQVYLRT
jgi:chemotaxis protein methyltransferase CheR